MHADGGLCTARHAALVDGKGAECHGRQHACRQETETDSSLVTRFAEQTGLSKFLCGCSGVHADGGLCAPGYAALAHDQRAQLHGGQHAAAGSHHGPRAVPQSGGVPA